MNNRIFASATNIKKSYYSDCDRELKIEYEVHYSGLLYCIHFVDPITQRYGEMKNFRFECKSVPDLMEKIENIQERIAYYVKSDIDSGIVQESVVTVKKIAERYFGGHDLLDRDIVHIYSETKSVRSYC